MSQQGDRRTGTSGDGDDWWGKLYDESDDTGPVPAPDTLDDRFDSAFAASTVFAAPEEEAEPKPEEGRASYTPPRAPWEPLPGATGVRCPTTFGPEFPQPAPEPTLPDLNPPSLPAHAPGPDHGSAPAWGPASAYDPTRDPTRGPAPEPGSTPGHAPPTAPPTVPLAAAPPRPPVPPSRTSTGSRTSTEPGAAADVPEPPAPAEVPQPAVALSARPTVGYVGDGPPTYDAEPTALPAAEPDALDGLVADTVLDGAHYGTSTLRAASVRGDSARYRGEPRRDSLLTARFGTGDGALILVAMATGARATPGAHRAAAEACRWIGRAVGRSHARLSEDIRAARRGDLKSGLHRLTDRSLGRLRASAAELGVEPEEYTATSLRCLLIPADAACRTRVFFGVGGGGLFRLREGEWQDIEPAPGEATGAPVVGFGSVPEQTPDGDRLTMDLGIPTPASPYDLAAEPPREPFRFRASVARPGDTLLLCTGGLAEPLRGEPELAGHLRQRWTEAEPPGLTAFLADTQLRVKGYADDRTACAIWEA
ncbi:protein phosphatase 2C domain-containing protein [Streptomyces sp. NBC_01304]|uniref:protein phosphatase 2C domain-containing protein n=1 Tax=Streptomyces sp. NBC_01304 TaxID=2903818 RepID=UPI002E0FA964|nr:protein phosphatase 2C domain-containing protein [Streptomyces sp. NBC_01304]